jgi:hypothetical protein
MLSDTFNIQEADGGVLWEADCRKYLKGAENFELEGANPSAEGDDVEEGGEGTQTMVHDIEEQFRMVWLKTDEGMKPSKDAFKGHLKSTFCLHFPYYQNGKFKILTWIVVTSLR